MAAFASAAAGVFSSSKLGEYSVVCDIAEGAFAIVKLAIHTVTGQQVAMKYISKAAITRQRMRTRVKREFEYMRALKHPHITKLYEVISTPTDIIFVLEYAGKDMFNYIVENGSMPEEQARRAFQQIISGIEYSHRLKIVHRDLKPENVLLDSNLHVKITDFGLSSQISDGDFLKTSCGSPSYAAPEVINGGMYAGPEIDVWSSGVILFVMLCGRLPFDDEDGDVQRLFMRINQGQYEIPEEVGDDARDLIQRMLVVDPLKRITIPEIIDHPFFFTDLPVYLLPLPPQPAMLGTLSSLVEPPTPVDFEVIAGLGRVETDVVDELASLMNDITKDEVWEMLNRDDGIQGNTMKVAYQLLRDKRKMGVGLAKWAEQERAAQIAAMDPRNGIPSGMISPAIRSDDDNPFEERDFGTTGDEYCDEDEDNVSLFDSETSLESSPGTYGVLSSSLPEHHLSSYALARATQNFVPEYKKQKRQKWHFGIRSRSPPMEIMVEIYRTLKQLGMEWKEKSDLGGLGGIPPKKSSSRNGTGIERNRDLDGNGVDMKAAGNVYTVETRARVSDVVVLMNIQLYMIDSINYLVDFHHKGSYRAATDPGAGKFDMAPSPSTLTEERGPDYQPVISPYLFMDLACRLILELASESPS